MSVPTLPEGQESGTPERLHPLFLLSGLGGSLRGIAGGYVAIGYLAVSGRWQTAVFGGLGLLAFVAVGVFLYWSRFSFRVTESDVRIDSGIISRRHRSIPFDRIQDVDITQGVIARLLGLAEVKFETGGGAAGPNAEEAIIHAITIERAHQIRELVRARRGAVAPAAVADERPPVYAMDLARLLISGTFNFSLAVFAGLFGVTQTFGDVLGFDPLKRRFWTSIFSADHPIAQFLFAHQVASVLVGLLLLVLVGILTGLVRTIVRDFGFRLDRTTVGLRRRRGLLTRTDVTVPTRRVQAVIVATGPVRDRFGWRELKLQSLARDEGGGDHVLAPLASDPEIGHVLREIDWQPVGGDLPWQRISRTYVSAFALALAPAILILTLFLTALAVAPLSDVQSAEIREALAPSRISATVLLCVIGAAIALRWLAWRRTAYVLDEDRLLVRSGWWRRRLTILPKAKIQSIDLTENVVTRLFGTATLEFGVAGGGTGGHIIPAIPSRMARQLRDQLLH